jgi:hypothetical protein
VHQLPVDGLHLTDPASPLSLSSPPTLPSFLSGFPPLQDEAKIVCTTEDSSVVDTKASYDALSAAA